MSKRYLIGDTALAEMALRYISHQRCTCRLEKLSHPVKDRRSEGKREPDSKAWWPRLASPTREVAPRYACLTGCRAAQALDTGQTATAAVTVAQIGCGAAPGVGGAGPGAALLSADANESENY